MSAEEMKKLEDEKLDQVAGGLKSDYEIACEVIEGYWGNGDERIRRLSAAGYNPYSIQSMVNGMLANGYDDPYRRKRPPFPPNYVDPYK